MARIEFKAKVKTMHYAGSDDVAYQYVTVPELKRAHCDMQAFRSHAKYGGYANSDLFPGMLKRIRADVFSGGILKLHQVPDCVTVDTSGFLARVSFEV